MLSWLVGNVVWDTIITIAIIAAITMITIAFVKYENSRPYFVVVFTLAMLFGGVFSGFKMYDYYSKQRNQVHGEIVQYNPYEDFDFETFNLKNLTFYLTEENNFEANQNYDTSTSFDGSNGNYYLLLNNSPCTNTQATYGKIQGDTKLAFYDIDNSLLSEVELSINISFYSSSTKVRITTNCTEDSIGYLREYIQCNGFEIRILNAVYENETKGGI